ncbi:Type III restriction-modification system methylation subunit [Lunatimonas lonarensis]|uniref:site-specific DNA-methyltransferase (adenine-specific) n=1 Tax=Lunatimonas lonarensis TaxID=1232681 RepID=R7ZVN1_9BACT|nr:site-specific DNA-methyltransferase [Lunatimonas lonarensis]EON78132.1 Type III restriction-modification system methylation subunit [Lunatimonas lonarensis]
MPDRLDMQSPDLVKDNIEKLAALFPNCLTEGPDGKAIDFDLLRQELSHQVVEGTKERYRLEWPGKKEAIVTANIPTTKTLRPVREDSVDFDTTENLYIEGDNLEVLKLLQESYLGKIKMIYIDPPYNTGNDFVYKDNFSKDSEEELLDSGQKDEYNQRLVPNPESSGRYHSDWLSMMYPRLKLARNLLTDDGVIFISIDDNEGHNLRKVCEDIFGISNFQTEIIWQKRYTRSNNTVDFTTVVESIVVFSKSENFIVNLLSRTQDADDRYTNPDNDPRGPWKGASFLNPATPAQRPNLCYPIQNPFTKKITNPTTNAWRRRKEEYERLLEENKLYWGKDKMSEIPSIKMFLSEARGLTPTNFWDHIYAGNTDNGTKELEGLFQKKLFDYPKPSLLIKRILEHSTENDCLVLDFFSGSATTAQAVLDLNAEDGGKRKYILVQVPEKTNENSEAYKYGYKNICEIGKERIRRAAKKIKEEKLAKAQQDGLFADYQDTQDYGFRVYRLDSSNMQDVYYSPKELQQGTLDLFADHIKPDRTADDLLAQVMLDWGLPLSLKIEQEQVSGKQVFKVAGNSLVACFDKGIDESFAKEIAEHKPMRIVFKDASFRNDTAKENVKQLLKQLSPETEMKVI